MRGAQKLKKNQTIDLGFKRHYYTWWG